MSPLVCSHFDFAHILRDIVEKQRKRQNGSVSYCLPSQQTILTQRMCMPEYSSWSWKHCTHFASGETPMLHEVQCGKVGIRSMEREIPFMANITPSRAIFRESLTRRYANRQWYQPSYSPCPYVSQELSVLDAL